MELLSLSKPLFHCLLLTTTILLSTTHATPGVPKLDTNPKWWKNVGKMELRETLRSMENKEVAKNIILFVGSGLDLTTVNAARIYKGHLMGNPGEENLLQMETLDDFAVLKTYSVDKQVAGRASAATALTCGVKNNDKTVGVNGRVTFESCTLAQSETPLSSILEYAIDAGKAAGIVTNGRLTQGAAAACYATSASDEWEGDVNLPEGSACTDIAAQLMTKDIRVLFGGGRQVFLDNSTADIETGAIEAGQRQDGRNLVDEWVGKHSLSDYVTNFEDFSVLDSNISYALGLFDSDVMDYELDRTESGQPGEPSLSNMTVKAIDILSSDRDGFFLLVEAARLADAHKAGFAKKALYETLSLDDAIAAVLAHANINLTETLIVVAGDRAQAMSMAGYARRGNNLLGLINPDENLPTDIQPRSVITYLNGPGYVTPREDLSSSDLEGNDFVYPSGVPMSDATDTATDVPVYASGPLSFMFKTSYEQSYVANVMAYSACIGEFNTSCSRIPL